MEGYDIFNINYCYQVSRIQVHSSWNPELEEDRKFREAVQQYEEQLKKVMEENNRNEEKCRRPIHEVHMFSNADDS